MRSWDSVIVTNEKLEHYGQSGRVLSSEPFRATPTSPAVAEVKLDTEPEPLTFEVTDLKVL